MKKNNIFNLIDRLEAEHSLTLEEYEYLIDSCGEEAMSYIAPKALKTKKAIYGDSIYIRGLIEISNICKNDCRYCGIRASNANCTRYRLTEEEILSCCRDGYGLGFRTFVLQGGEDMYFDDDILCKIVKDIKSLYPDCAVTLSMGERSFESYQNLYNAGADRYLLRHETADKEHYSKLHPPGMSFENRMECLKSLKDIGYQTGCGFMVGSPYQTSRNLAMDLKFIEEFQPHMCGIGPFIPHKDTEFSSKSPGSVALTCFLLAIIRLMNPRILLPATTALATLSPTGREAAVRCGANVVMPNLSPEEARKNYTLYNNKAHSGGESAKCLDFLQKQLDTVGAKIVIDRGDIKQKGI